MEAIIAPKNCDKINAHTCFRDVPPINSVGDRLLAGFNDAPVR